MADDVTPDAPKPEPEIVLVPSRQERARRSSYRLRFGLIYVFLAAVVGAGVGSFIVLASEGKKPDDPAWSAWQPKGSTTARVRQIADRIPKAYRTENGAQLTVSLAGPLSVPTPQGEVPVRAVFVRPDTSKGLAEEDDIAVYPGNAVVSFGLCGTRSKEQCEVGSKVSAEQQTLLRREALELSLYTLKYVDGIDSVVVFMPPEAKSQSTVFLRRSDVTDELDRPLNSLLPTTKPKVGGLNSLEEGQILRLTRTRTYSAEVQASPDGSPVLILTPPGQDA
jgi:hypothetical protein